jgi:light-regulated signal transduction histidine kinase (bacteriophytochrome)
MSTESAARKQIDPPTSIHATSDLLRAEEARHAEELSKFVYSICHDLSDPLRTISSFTELLQRRCGGQLDAEGSEFMGYILDAAERMHRFLSDLLHYSQQIRGFDKPLSIVDSGAVLRGVLLSMQKEIVASGAEISCDSLPLVESDYDSLAQVFLHLLSNSLRFRAQESPRIHVSAEQTDRETKFAVRDNGIGIDPRYHDHIFEAFRRLHGRQYPGSGFGLAVCKLIVERHGGRIWVESQPGSGAVFRFTLPT